MYLLAPANPKEFINRALWFKSPLARKLQSQKKVEFGFEIKGHLKEITQAPDLFWGVHLPVALATNWYYNPERRIKIINEVEKIAKLKPHYAVLHGISLLWKPPSKTYINRYFNISDASEHLKVLHANIKFINQLKTLVPLKIENGLVVDFYYKNDEIPFPYTYLHTGVQKVDDFLYIHKKTGVDCLLDIEHLILSLNFLNREKNYRNLPVEKIDHLSSEDEKLQKIFGYYLKKNYIPYAQPKIKLEDVVKKCQAKIFHLSGNSEDVVSGRKILSHGPIDPKNKTFRKNLRLILAQKPEILVLETANASIPGWEFLRPNETEISFENLCQILLEEL